jgi:cell division protease FtsH
MAATPAPASALATAGREYLMNLFTPRISADTHRLINALIGSPARRLTDFDRRVTWDDVGGLEQAKESAREIVDFLRAPMKYRALGARIPKHILLTGPPGCGKTLLAQAVLGTAGVPAFQAWGSEFVLLAPGVGAARLRNMFKTGAANKPALLLIDDIDAIARRRGAGRRAETELELNHTLTQLMKEMDDRRNNGVLLLATTSRPDLLDPALLQPARFDRILKLEPPDERARQGIFAIYLRDKPLEADVDAALLAARTPEYTGAAIARLVNEAALLAVRRDRETISLAEFETALDRLAEG